MKMACFVAPAAEAVITTITTKVVQSGEKSTGKFNFSRKMKWLSNMLWGGSALLAFEHVWHGEVTPWFPFLTAANPAETAEVLREMATSGTAMAALITFVWFGMVAVTSAIEKKALPEAENQGA